MAAFHSVAGVPEGPGSSPEIPVGAKARPRTGRSGSPSVDAAMSDAEVGLSGQSGQNWTLTGSDAPRALKSSGRPAHSSTPVLTWNEPEAPTAAGIFTQGARRFEHPFSGTKK